MLGLVVLLVLVMFLLSNRDLESLNLWPFGFLLALPVGAVMIAVLVIGFLAGLIAHLPKRFGSSRRLKKAEKRIAELEAKLAVASVAISPSAAVPAQAAVPAPSAPTGFGRGKTLLIPARQTTIVP